MSVKIPSSIDFVMAKVRALHARMDEGEHLEAMVSCRSLVDLGRAWFPSESLADPPALEHRLIEEFSGSLVMLCRYLKPPLDGLFVAEGLRLELENLKVLLRARLAGQGAALAALPQWPTPPQFQWPRLHAAEVAGLWELVAAVGDARLRSLARAALRRYEETKVPLVLEAGLDYGYFRMLSEAWQKLPAVDRRGVEPLLRFAGGLYSLMLLLRGRINYHLPPALLAEFCAPSPGRGGAPRWAQAAAQPDTAREIVALAPAALAAAVGDLQELPAIERRLWEHLAAMARSAYYHRFDVAGLYGFVLLKRVELANRTTLVEALHYGLTTEETSQRLLRPVE